MTLLGQELAGKYQANAFYAIMQNYEKLKEVKETAENSEGSAAQEQETYINSLEAKISAIKESMKGLIMSSSNVELFKGLIDGATTCIDIIKKIENTIGAFPSIIGVATTSFVMLNKEAKRFFTENNILGFGSLENKLSSKLNTLPSKLKKINKEIIQLKNSFKLGETSVGGFALGLGKLQAKTIGAKLSILGLKVAVIATEAAMTMGLSIAISAVVEGIVKLIDKLHMSKSELREFNQDIANSFNSNIEDIKKSEGLVDKINNTKIQISNTSDTQKQNELKKQLLDYEKQLADVLPNAATEFDNEGNAIATNTKLIQENILQKRQAAKDEVGDFISKNKHFQQHVDEYIKDQKRLQENQLKLRQIQDSNKGKKWYERTENTTALEKDIKKAKEDIKDYSAEINNLIKMKKGLESAGVNQSDIANIIGKDNLDALEKYNQHLEQTQTTADNTKPALEGLTNPLDAIKESATSAADELDKLGSKFNKLTGNIGLLQDAMSEFKKTGTLSAKTIGSMLNSGDTRIISLLRDKNKFMENSVSLEKTLREESNKTYQQAIVNAENLKQRGINDLSSKEAIETQAMNHSVGLSNEETQTKINNHSSEANAHANSEETKTSNAENGANDRKNTSDEETNHKGNNYTVDDKNHASLVNSKDKAAADGANSMQSTNDTMFDHFAETYKIDNENWNKLQQAKLKAFHNLVSAMGTADPTKSLSDKIGDFQKDVNKAKAEAIGIPNPYGWAIPDNIGSPGFDPIKPSSEAIQPNYSPEANGHGDKKGKGKGHKVDIKDIEDKIDAYKSLQDAIDDVNNELEITKTLEENATEASDKLYYMNQELLLYKDKKKAVNDLCWAKKQEAKALEKELVENGFEASKGNIANYKERLEAIKSNVNAMDNSNKAKEQAIKDYKELKEKADKYFALTSKEIPQLQKEWYSLAKTIKEVSKNQVKLMGEAERNMTSVVENEIEKRRKALEDDFKNKEEKYNKEEKLLEKETNKLKEELQKQKEAYDKKRDDDNFEKNLKEKQNELNKINSQIDSVRRDDSSEGQSKLKELLAKKEQIEKDLNNTIRDRQKQKGDELFDEASKKIEDNNKQISDKLNQQKEELAKNKEETFKKFDEKYNKETITQLAKGMITKGFIEIEGHMVNLRDALNDYYKKNGEVFADSSLKLQEQIDKLELTKKLYEEINSINNNLGISSSNIRYNNGNNVVQAIPKVASFMTIPQGSKKANIKIESNLHIGSVHEGTTEDIKSMLDERDRKIINQITEELHTY